MATPKITTGALLGLAFALASCVVPKATIVVEQAPVVKKEEKQEQEPVVSEAAVPELPDDGLRMPDMLGLPSDGEFRPTHPISPKTGSGSGAVISRPPTDPPSRVKPKAPDPE